MFSTLGPASIVVSALFIRQVAGSDGLEGGWVKADMHLRRMNLREKDLECSLCLSKRVVFHAAVSTCLECPSDSRPASHFRATRQKDQRKQSSTWAVT
jgi:hypothetical protein